MSARTAAKMKARKGLDTSLFIDGEFSHREAVCDVRTGPPENTVTAKATILVCDNEDDRKVDTVLVHWTMGRDCFKITGPKPGQSTLTREEPDQGDDSFKLDEVEAWATALYRAVQLAKTQGYLPNGDIKTPKARTA